MSTSQTATQLVFADGVNPKASQPTNGEATGDGASPQGGQIFGTGSMLNVSSISIAKRMVRYLSEQIKRALGVTSSLRIAGVEFAANSSDTRSTVLVKREVIIAAGAIHTPQLLMLSGVGARSILQSAGVVARVDLPGVGSNLQDHMQVACWYPYQNPAYQYPNQLNTDQRLVDQSWSEYWRTKTGLFTSIAVNGVAFPSLVDTTSTFASIAELAASQSSLYLSADTDPSVKTGFAKQLPLLTRALRDRNRAAWEILNANDGDLSIANMRPFSRGTVTLRSADPFVPPEIDPRYGSNPIDTIVVQAAIWFNARLLRTRAMADLQPLFVAPAENASMHELDQHIRTRAQTEYHVSGTAALMPRELGGVVDPALMVYGTSNLRVVDASIFPLVPAAHLQAVVYAVAERVSQSVLTTFELTIPW